MKKTGTGRILMIVAIALGAAAVIFVACLGIKDAIAYSYTKVEEQAWQYTYWFSEGEKDDPAVSDKVDIVEKFDSSSARNVNPGENFGKTIDLRSNATFDAYAYIMLEIDTVSAYKSTESSPKVYDSCEPKINTSYWTCIYQNKAASAGTRSRYIYRYNEILTAGSTTATGGDTKSLCTLVKIPEFTEIDDDERSIAATGYIIQSTGFTRSEADKEAINALTK